MSIEKGKAYLSRFGIEDRVREFDVSSATVELAAQALGVKGQRIAKSRRACVEMRRYLLLPPVTPK